jgi:AcrR family transcriptional regulator
MSDFMSTIPRPKDARRPVQERSAARMAKVLEAAERMLADIGPEKTSIPALAEISGVPRAAIYPFFPDKYALFSHLAQLHMQRLTETLAASKAERTRTWRDWIEAVINVVADYYNDHPAASVLLLRGGFTDADRAAHEAKNVAMGQMLRTRAEQLGWLQRMPTTPDVASIAIELAFACMKYGYAREGTVSPVICQEAARAVTSYLTPWEIQR